MLSRGPRPAIVIGGGSANGLGIVRNLGRHGIPAYAVTSNPGDAMCASRYCTGSMILPVVERDPTRLRHVLLQLIPHISAPGVLFPTTDTALLTVAAIRDHLPSYVTFIPDRAVVETMVNKSQFYPSLQRHRVPHPTTFSLQHTPLEDILPQVSFPLYLRPAQSLLFTERFGCKGFIVHTRQELSTALARVQRARFDVLVQEVIPGPTACGYIVQGYFDQRSQPIVIVAAQKLRQPTLISNQSVQVSIPPSWVADGIQTLTRYFQRIGYRGLFGAEFKRDPRDGVFKLLEVNARSMGGNCFEEACGANDIFAAYCDVLGYPVTPMLTYQTDVYFISEIVELDSIVSLLFQRALRFRDLLSPYRASKKTLVYLSSEDPLPFFQQLAQRLRQLPTGVLASKARL